MQSAKVIAKANATMKHPALNGWRLLLVQPLGAKDDADGDPQLVIDNLGSALGDRVIITADGAAVRDIMGMDDTPVRYAIIGIDDKS